MIIPIIIVGAFVMMMSKQTPQKQVRKVLVKVPFPSGQPTYIPEDKLADYGYVIQGNMVYHITELNANVNSGALTAQNIQNWATTTQNIIDQGLDAYTAVNQALVPKLNVVANFDLNTYTYSAQDGFTSKNGNGSMGQSFQVKLNNSKHIDFNATSGTTKISIVKTSDGTELATKTVNFITKKVT